RNRLAGAGDNVDFSFGQGGEALQQCFGSSTEHRSGTRIGSVMVAIIRRQDDNSHAKLLFSRGRFGRRGKALEESIDERRGGRSSENEEHSEEEQESHERD